MLEVNKLNVWYGRTEILRDVTFSVPQGEIVALLGGNGSGKTTILNTLSGLLKPRAGSIKLGSTELAGRSPAVIVRSGMTQVPQGREVFASMTVLENLQMGALLNKDHEATFDADLAKAEQLFPILAKRRDQRAGTMSGGEQQMLAIARALMGRPRLLLLDEPSLGLAPLIVKQIFEVIAELNKREGLTIFLVEQNAYHALKLAHRAYVMVNGRITLTGTGAELLAKPEVRAAYLEGGGH